MTENFMQVDHFADISAEVVNDLQRRLARGNDNDLTAIKGTYTAHVLSEYAYSFSLDADEVSRLTVNEDGSADGNGRRYTGQPSLSVFIEYLRKGR